MDFEIKDGVLTKYTGQDEHVVVPDGVVEIGPGSFFWNGNKGNIKRITLPRGIKKIGERAFEWCGGLEQIIIPEGVISIGKGVFNGCSSLTELTLPASLEEIYGNSFDGCSQLKEIRIPQNVKSIESGIYNRFAFSNMQSVMIDPENPYYCAVDGIVYNAEKTKIIGFPKGVSGEVNIPEGIESIPDDTFRDRLKIEHVNLPKTIKEIGNYAFARSGIKSITIPNSVQRIGGNVFLECTDLITVVLPDNITDIPGKTFMKCESLEIVESQNLKKIGEQAFFGCKKLTQINISEDAIVGDGAFKGCNGLADSNGFVIINKMLFDYVGDSTEVVVPDEVEIIKTGSLTYRKVKQVKLPETIKIIEDDSLNAYNLVDLPNAYLQQNVKLPADMTFQLLNSRLNKYTSINLGEGISLKDCAALQLFQTAKKIVDTAKKFGSYISENPEDTLKEMIDLLKEQGKATHFQKAADYCLENRKSISQESINDLYYAAKAAKAKKAAESLSPYAKVVEEKGRGNDSKSVDEIKTKDVAEKGGEYPIEAFCLDLFTPSLLEKYLKKQKISDKLFKSVKYKNTDQKAPAFVVECAVVPYMQQLEKVPTTIGQYEKDYCQFSIDPNADKVAAELDPESFGELLDKLIGKDMPSVFQTLVPYGRYATGKQISNLTSRMNKWKKWNEYSTAGRRSIIVARGAILLNDSREAMLYADKSGALDWYAKIRELDTNVLRDNNMSDFGLDKNGKKYFDLGNTIIEVSVNKDLKLRLFDTNAAKEVKSIPKRGADPDKYEKAKAEFADIKKNLKAIVKNRTELLFASFLHGNTRKAESWKSSYLKNYILHKVGELVVWNQKGKTFILAGKGVVDCNGHEYIINDKDPINVAHPIQMNLGERKAWQQYFTSHGLKQPFEQVWEPVIDMDKFKPDRYEGRMIPYFRFVKQEKHGIHVRDWNYHNEIEITFEDCKANVERIDWARHEISMDHRFEVKSIKVPKATRMSNHILALLDRYTSIDRVIADDVTIVDTLHDCSLAQITDYINIANENNANNVLAALLEYKNNNYSDFDPMDDFILD